MQTSAGSFANDDDFFCTVNPEEVQARSSKLAQIRSLQFPVRAVICVCVWGCGGVGSPQLVQPQGEVDGSPRVAPHTEDSLCLPGLL